MTNARSDYDVIVVGSGVAGLSVALGLAGVRRVAIVSDGPLGGGSTAWAQGGLAGAVSTADDASLHAKDTAAAGAWLGDDEAIGVVTSGAVESLADLLRVGGRLDRDDAGRLSLTREGGHDRRRIVHAGGDATGAEVSRALTAAVREADVEVIDRAAAVDHVPAATHTRHAVGGVVVRRTHADRVEEGVLTSRAVVLATGGIGGLYAASTNPQEVRGCGLALALRAGAALVDVEFVQFHPTALAIAAAAGQVPLISEAIRGEGAILRDATGRAIMAGRHPLADLAPRDVVARRIDEVIRSGGRVYLDATALGADLLRHRFPTIVGICRQHGIDPATDPIPVAPAQHFLCGGVRTDTWGATDVCGLYAVGEVAATGLHGANRLASNSLIEALVIGRRIAARLALELPAPIPLSLDAPSTRNGVADRDVTSIRATMSSHAGIRRTGAGLEAALDALSALTATPAQASVDASHQRLAAMAIVAAAAARRESRGCHWRSDHPQPSERWRRRVIVRLDADGLPTTETTPALQRSA
jgi:L-aspartate oxidase